MAFEARRQRRASNNPLVSANPTIANAKDLFLNYLHITTWSRRSASRWMPRRGFCHEMERFNQLDWPVQRERIAAFVKRWRARLVMDATRVGDPVFDDLRRVLPQVEGFKITAQTKRELVQGLKVAVEQRRVMWPAAGRREDVSRGGAENAEEIFGQDDRIGTTGSGPWDVLTAEMKRYEYDNRQETERPLPCCRIERSRLDCQFPNRCCVLVRKGHLRLVALTSS